MKELIISIIIILIIYIIYQLYKFIQPNKQLQQIPGLNFYECLPFILQDIPYNQITSSYSQIIQKYGLSKIHINGVWTIMISEPKMVHQILHNPRLFPKINITQLNPNSILNQMLGSGLVFCNGQQWKRQRLIMNPTFKLAFNTLKIHQILNQLNFIFFNKVVQFENIIHKITLECLIHLILGLDDNNKNIKNKNQFIQSFGNILKELLNPFYMLFTFLETPSNPLRHKIYKDLNYVQNYIAQAIYEKQVTIGTLQETNDLLTNLIKAHLTNTANFSKQELIHNIITLLFAGHDTSAFSISIVLYFLAKDLKIQDKVRSEMIKILGKDPNTVPTENHLGQFKYTESVILESMRMYPPSAIIPFRTNVEDVYLGNYFIPKGSHLTIDLMNLHRNENLWNKPNQFLPDRFLNSSDYKGKYLPFGEGMRLCIGSKFAMLEIKTILHYFLTRFEVKLVGDTHLKLKSNPVLTVENLNLKFNPIIL